MSEKTSIKERFILQIILLLVFASTLFGSFVLVDRYHERYVNLKIAELNLEYKKTVNNEE